MMRSWIVFVLAALLMGSMAPVFAQETPEQQPQNEQPAVDPNDPSSLPVPDLEPTPPRQEFNSSDIFYNTMGKLLMVLGVVVFLGWLARRYLPNKLTGLGSSGDSLRMVQSLPLGPRRFVSIIEADGRRLLIGVTDNGINLIQNLSQESFGDTLADVQEPKRVRELWEEES